MHLETQTMGRQPAPARHAPAIGELFAESRARALAPMLRGSALVALAALLLSPPVIAAYSIWPALLALFWFIWVTLSWWLCESGRTRTAAVAFVTLTWLTFTIPAVFSLQRFSEGNVVASLVIAALLLPWPGIAVAGLASLLAAGGAVALDGTAYALPLLFPTSNYLRLAAMLLELSLVVIALCLTTRELRASVKAGIGEACARADAESAPVKVDGSHRALLARLAGAEPVRDGARAVAGNAAAAEPRGRSSRSTPDPHGPGQSNAEGA